MTFLKISLTLLAVFYISISTGFARDFASMDPALTAAKLQGSGRLTWWGFHIYDASFYRSGNLSSSEFALDMRYHKSFTGISIANRRWVNDSGGAIIAMSGQM